LKRVKAAFGRDRWGPTIVAGTASGAAPRSLGPWSVPALPHDCPWDRDNGRSTRHPPPGAAIGSRQLRVVISRVGAILESGNPGPTRSRVGGGFCSGNRSLGTR